MIKKFDLEDSFRGKRTARSVWSAVFSTALFLGFLALLRFGALPFTGCAPVSTVSPPADLVRCPGAPASFHIVVAGSGPFSYQWSKNGTNISGCAYKASCRSTSAIRPAGAFRNSTSRSVKNIGTSKTVESLLSMPS